MDQESISDPLMIEEHVEYPRPPAPHRHINFIGHLTLAAYWFGSNFIWGALLGVVNASEVEVLDPLNKAKTLGLLSAVGATVALIIPLIVGALSDRCTSRYGRRSPYMLFGGVLCGLGLIAMFLSFSARNLNLFFGSYFLLQFGSNTALAAYSGVIPDQVPEDQRGVASGYMAFMSQFSTLLGALAAGIFVNNPLVMYGIMLVVFATFLAWTLLGMREVPLEKAEPYNWGEYFAGLIAPLRHRDFAWVWITRALMMLGFYAIQPFILYYLKDLIGVKNPGKEAGFMIAIILFGATVSGVLGGAISDRIGRKPIVYLSSGIIAAMSLAFIFCQTMTHVLIAGIIFGLGYGAYISVDWALGTDVLPSEQDAGKDMAVWHVSMTFPQAIGGLVGGIILSSGRSMGDVGEVVKYTRQEFGALFIFSAICFTLGAVLLRNVKGAR
ncbi:MAG: MFS transporter [Armatimonadetes bacterium]|nr:MFS transporter [Armatimonadota bacterium]